MNILDEANKIVNERSEEKSRMYGDFNEGMERCAKIFNVMTGMNLSAKEMFYALIALKFSRESFNHKEDNLLDIVAYIGALNNYINNKNKQNEK